MHKLRRKFTKWYYRKGYKATYLYTTDNYVFSCPWYVKPLLFLFSPSIYNREIGEELTRGFWKGIEKIMKENEQSNYETSKSEISNTARDPKDYERQVKEFARKMGI